MDTFKSVEIEIGPEYVPRYIDHGTQYKSNSFLFVFAVVPRPALLLYVTTFTLLCLSV